MSTDLLYGHRPAAVHPHPKGVHALYRFPNGYGASVIGAGPLNPDIREIMVIKWVKPGVRGYELITGTPLCPDVLHAPTGRIEDILRQIATYTDEQVRASQERYDHLYQEEDR